MLEIVGTGIISREPGRGAYMPVVTPLPNGMLIASQHVGRGLGSPDNHIEVLRSDDGGETWVNQGSIHHESPTRDGWSYRAPAITPVPDGRLMMKASRFEKKASTFNVETESSALCELLLFWSSDLGATWSNPHVVPVDLARDKYNWNGAGTILQLSPERWMYPLETWKPEGLIGPPDQKAAAIFSSDQGRTWGDFTIIADDPSGRILWWDQMCSLLPDGRIYSLLWTHRYGTSEDLNNHWTVSKDQGRTWTEPKATNLKGQVCAPVPLPDGRVAAVYNYRHHPQGIRVAITEDLTNFDVENEIVVFDAGAEATLGAPQNENFLAEHMLIAFGKPGGVVLTNGDIVTYFWCTSQQITHTRWARLKVL